MGRERHHAIVISTAWSERADEARMVASSLLCNPTEVVHTEVNGVHTFLIPPDGGNEGLGASWQGDQRRDELVAWLEERNAEDENLQPFQWCEVQYGDDDDANGLLRSSRWNDADDAT